MPVSNPYGRIGRVPLMRSRVLVMVHMKPCSVVFAFDVFDGRRAFLPELVNNHITHLDFNECVWPFWPLFNLNLGYTTLLLGVPSILLSLILFSQS